MINDSTRVGPFRIVITDDHTLIREGLKTLLKGEKDMQVIAEARSAEGLLAFLREHEADVIILDVSMPGRSGLDVMREIRQLSKAVVVFLTIHPEKRYALRAFKAGAAAYLTKESAPSELIHAIRKAIAGEKYVSEEMSNELVLNLTGANRKQLHQNLSDREFEVFLKLAEGKDAHEIARELSLSEATVYSHREHVMEKMNMKSIPELTRYAIAYNLME